MRNPKARRKKRCHLNNLSTLEGIYMRRVEAVTEEKERVGGALRKRRSTHILKDFIRRNPGCSEVGTRSPCLVRGDLRKRRNTVNR